MNSMPQWRSDGKSAVPPGYKIEVYEVVLTDDKLPEVDFDGEKLNGN